MSNTQLTASIVAKEALMILENEVVMPKLVYRGYEPEFDKNVNGYTPGNSINIRRPADFTIRSGRTASAQDVVEGEFPLVLNTQIGVDFKFTSQELTQNIKSLSERVIRPAMIQLANKIDGDLLALASASYNWVGTPGNPIGTFKDLAKGAERMDLLGVPSADRAAVLSPTDYWAMASSSTALFVNSIAQQAYRNGELGIIAGLNTYMSQNVLSFTRGAALTATASSGTLSSTYAATLNSNTQSFAFDFATSKSIAAGDVFTLSGVNAVNPVTKATSNYLQQFVVIAAVGGTGTVTATITPPIITSGAFQTVSAAPTASSVATFSGAASTVTAQNLIFAKQAMTLAMAPMVSPPGAVDVSRQSYKGLSVRVIPFYNGAGDESIWRLDMLYGVKLLDPRQITRVSGQ